ncbi:MAG TPA: YfjI family protein [Bacteroidales bacterium]|nr:YfjI family protein [Bacteroidales bacterium]HRZ49550.1 YfjI family protein [Bacteroidales bacterium]
MQEQNTTSTNSHPMPEKVIVTFDYDKYGIGIEEIKSDAEQHLAQFNEDQERKINRFPVEIFPVPVQQIINATNETLNFPIDFIGASLLYAASIAIGNTHRVEVMRGWQESAVIYLAIVARTGTNKSHPLSFALQPIIENDKRTYRQYEQQRQEYEKEICMTKKNRQEQLIDAPKKPVWRKCLVSDFTPEALADVHKFNKRGIGVYVDELAGWIKNFNRYSKGSEMEFWLSQWSGKPINIDRKSGEPIFIPMPFISVAGTIQNGILNELAKENRNQNGFIDRILFVIPDNIQKEYWSEADLPPIVSENWERIVLNLLGMQVAYDDTLNPKPVLLKFTPEAKKILLEWQKKNTDQCNEEESESLCGIFSKMDMYVVRLALILEMMSFACHESDKQAVSIEAVQGAVKLVEYFKNAAVKVNTILSNSNPLDVLPLGKQELYNALPDTFSTESGLKIAVGLGISERTFKYFLNEKDLFIKLSRGEYKKRI